MNRTFRASLAVLLIAVIGFSAISICQNLMRSWRMDITDQKLYTLSDGAKQILGGLNQPIQMKLYYTKTATLKANDQIRFFNNYYYYVRALLDEFVKAGKGMVQLQVIDPRPYSDEELEAIRHNLKRFAISEDENFFFGLVVQTQFGVTKTIDFFSPDRQSFVEYDIAYLVDTAITRAKKRVGILSPLPVIGDDATGYMAQMMRMQGQQPQPAWGIVSHLKQSYDISSIPADTQEIKDIDILMVIHPKNLSEKAQWAIDQFVLKGGPTVIYQDPHAVIDKPNPMQRQMGAEQSSSSGLPALLTAWGLEMPENTFAGDLALTDERPMRPNEKPVAVIPLVRLQRDKGSFNSDVPITAQLNTVQMFFSGILRQLPKPAAAAPKEEAAPSNVKLTPLLTTTAKGNAWKVSSPFELMSGDFSQYVRKFTPGTEPVAMGYLVTGRPKSAFPNGIEVPVETPEANPDDPAKKPEDKKETKTQKLTGLTEASADCAVVVYADVDFISDMVAFQPTFFGSVPAGDNVALALNTLENLTGSSALISIRSRGNFKRPFVKVDQIESQAADASREEETKLQAEIDQWETQLNEKLASAKQGQDDLIANTIINEKRQIEEKIYQAKLDLRKVKEKKRKEIERLESRLRNFCTLPGPILILVLAVLVGVRRSVMRKMYISHASDA
jgi:ABC-2 type transport system permease protein